MRHQPRRSTLLGLLAGFIAGWATAARTTPKVRRPSAAWREHERRGGPSGVIRRHQEAADRVQRAGDATPFDWGAAWDRTARGNI